MLLLLPKKSKTKRNLRSICRVLVDHYHKLHRNWVTLPLIKERDELDDGRARLGSETSRELSFPGDPELSFRLKTWTVPLSLETASHCAEEENARLYISALSAPLRTYIGNPINCITSLIIRRQDKYAWIYWNIIVNEWTFRTNSIMNLVEIVQYRRE